MNKEELSSKISAIFSEIYEFQNEGESAPSLSDESILLDSGLDSLGFAILVTRLEEEIGYDPFTTSSDAYYPGTFIEFINFYYENIPNDIK